MRKKPIMNIINRKGSKKYILRYIYPHIPPHRYYIEPFFGTGAFFFNKEKAKYNTLNDFDGEVFNLFLVIKEKKEDFVKKFLSVPMNSQIIKYWQKNNEVDEVWKAVRFVYLNKYTVQPGLIKLTCENISKYITDNITETVDFIFSMLKDTTITNFDFRKFLTKIHFRRETAYPHTFIYADPPYFGTTQEYNAPAFTLQDTADLFDILHFYSKKGAKIMISELYRNEIIDLCNKYNFNIKIIKQKRICDKKETQSEAIITNYEKNNYFF